jgi:hypothetical protein
MSSNNRNQRGNFRGEYQNLSENERFRNQEEYRNRAHYDEPHHADGSSRFQGRENDDHLRREPSNQWGNARNYRSSHRGSDFGSGYFGSPGAYFGNYEGGNRRALEGNENQWYNTPDNGYYNQSGYEHDSSPYNRNRSRSYEESNYDRFNQGQNQWGSTHDNYSTSDNSYSRIDNQDGIHRGKGPKGYGRSDERIKEDINDRLSDHSYIDASEIEVMVKSGEVTLTGTVEDRISKRRAEDLAEEVSGVRNVENRLRVQKSEENRAHQDDSGKSSHSKTPNGVRTKSSLMES